MTEGRRQRSIVLILARELSSNIATPAFIVDPSGTLIFYNDAAEKILGQSYAESGELHANEWGRMWQPRTPDGVALRPEELPLTIAFAERRAAHRDMVITAVDGADHPIAVTAFPLLGTTDELVGAIAIFWESPG